MALTVASTSTTALTNVVSGSVILTKPSGLAVGDIMLAHITGEGSVSTPVGWTLVQAMNRSSIFYKVATSGDVAASNFTWTVSGTVSGGMMARITGDFNSATPYQVSYQSLTSQLNASFAVGLTQATADSLLFIMAGHRINSATVVTTSGYAIATNNPSWTELFDSEAYNGSGNAFGNHVAWASRPQQTATGNVSVNYSNTVDDAMCSLVIIRPAYVYSISESITTTETKRINTLLSLIEHTTIIENLVSLKTRLWRKVTKPITTWRKYNK